MEVFTTELISYAHFNGYPINSVGSFTNFSPEHIHLYGGLEAIISEIQYRPLY